MHRLYKYSRWQEARPGRDRVVNMTELAGLFVIVEVAEVARVGDNP